jgi:hypothetical protein
MANFIFGVVSFFVGVNETYISAKDVLINVNGKDSLTSTIVSIDRTAIRVLHNDELVINIEK